MKTSIDEGVCLAKDDSMGPVRDDGRRSLTRDDCGLELEGSDPAGSDYGSGGATGSSSVWTESTSNRCLCPQ